MVIKGGGLSALIPSKKIEPISSKNIPVSKDKKETTGRAFYIETKDIRPNPYQPRKNFNKFRLKQLADSIKSYGILQPLVVIKSEKGYQLISGERRLKAAKMINLSQVPVIVRNSKNQEKLELALAENIQRDNLNPIEKAYAFKRLINEFDFTQKQIGQKIGKSRVSITNNLRLLELPAEIQRALLESKITEGHARVILSLLKTENKLYLFKQIVDKKLSVRQTEVLAKKFSKGLSQKNKARTRKNPELRKIEEEISDKLGTRVKITKRGQKGKLIIEFYSKEDLDDIVKKLKK